MIGMSTLLVLTPLDIVPDLIQDAHVILILHATTAFPRVRTKVKMENDKKVLSLSYEDICFLTILLRKIDEEEAITLMCIIEQVLRNYGK